MNPLEHLKLIKDNPGVYKFIPDDQLADLLLQLIETKSLFKKAKVELKNGKDGKDGKTPKAGIDYMSRSEQEKLIKKLISKIEVPKPKDGKPGKDADITPELIDNIVTTVYDSLFPQLPVPLSSEEIRDRLELLLDDERLDKSAIKGIEDIEQAIEELRTRNSSATAVIARHLGQIRDVNTNGVTDGQVLTYEGATKTWKPTTVSTTHDWGNITGTLSDQTDLQAALDAKEPANANIQSHIASTSNPHSVTKSQVGLGNVDNTSDANKPVSTAQAAADALRVLKAGDTMTGNLNMAANILPTTNEARDIGSNSARMREVWSRRVFGVTGPGTHSLGVYSGALFGQTTHASHVLQNKSAGSFVVGSTAGSLGTVYVGALQQSFYPQAAFVHGAASTVTAGSGTPKASVHVPGTSAYGAFAQGYSWSFGTTSIAQIKSTAPGAFSQGYATANSLFKSYINASGIGSLAHGTCKAIAGTNSYLSAFGSGSTALGYISSGTLKSSGHGSFAAGLVTSNSTIEAGGNGSFAVGATLGGSLKATSQGSFAAGRTFSGFILSSGFGSFSGGLATSGGKIYATASGSFSHGVANGKLYATGVAAFAQGNVGSGGVVQASGNTAFAMGMSYNGTNTVIASGSGSFAFGYTYNGGHIQATALNSVQFGYGTNALANSLKVGNAGLRLKGNTGAPVTPVNGDIWINNNYVYIRSNGVSCKVTNAIL